MEETFYSVEDIARIMKLHPVTVRNHARANRKGWAKIGTYWRISKTDFEIWYNEFKEKPLKKRKPRVEENSIQ